MIGEWVCQPCYLARREYDHSASEESDALMKQLEALVKAQAAAKN